MAVIRLKSGRYQAKLPLADGKQISQTFDTRQQAQEQLARWKREKREGKKEISVHRPPTMDEFFALWFAEVSQETSKEFQSGWRKMQYQQYFKFVQPVLGPSKLNKISPQMVKQRVESNGRDAESASDASACFCFDAKDVRRCGRELPVPDVQSRHQETQTWRCH